MAEYPIIRRIESSSSANTMTQSERATWEKPSSFILAAVGGAAGLGNFWRFPNLAAEYVYLM